MASTYSTNLALELITTGEQAGTWGTSTNNNLGTLIEQAIVGKGAVNFAADADLTISISNGTSSAARCYYLVVTSGVSLTATRNLIVPTIQKTYSVLNSTTGGQSIVVKTVAGTGITIPNGFRVSLLVDGTNVIAHTTYSPSLDGVTQTGGDNSTKMATTAFVQGAVGAVSGAPTGAVIPFAGSSAPTGWLLCYGQAVSRATYSALFGVISTTYGAGDGSTTFNIPDCRGRVSAGQDNMGGSAANRLTSGGSGINGVSLGASGGAETVALSTANLASHTHGITDPTHSHSVNDPTHSHSLGTITTYVQDDAGGLAGPAVSSTGGGSTNSFPTIGGGTAAAATGISINGASTGISTNAAGSGTAHQNTQPTIVFAQIIKT